MREHDGTAVLLGERVRRRLDAIVDDLMERQWREVPELWVTDDPAFREAVERSTRDNIELLIGALRRPTRTPFALPPGAVLEADTAARYGARIDALLRTYRLGQQAMTEHFLDVIEESEPAEASVALAQLRTATRTVHQYMDAVMPLVWREYDDERDRLATHPDIGRLRVVQAALAGNAAQAPALGYDVTGAHVAVVAGDPGTEAVVGACAGALGVAILAVRASDGRCWAWLDAEAAGVEVQEVIDRLRAGGVAGAAGVGGPAGFRAAHRQAMLAERIARTRGSGIVDVQTVALEALALGDQRTAWEVARAELGPLADTDRHASLVATLEAWFAARESIAYTAAAVGVAPRTVSYRLRRAEALLGHPIAARRAELETALRVQRLFAAGAPPGP
jgi:PucR-like helix-turn-helix protein